MSAVCLLFCQLLVYIFSYWLIIWILAPKSCFCRQPFVKMMASKLEMSAVCLHFQLFFKHFFVSCLFTFVSYLFRKIECETNAWKHIECIVECCWVQKGGVHFGVYSPNLLLYLMFFSELTQVDVDSREFEVDYRFSWRIGFARQWPHAKTVSSS